MGLFDMGCVEKRSTVKTEAIR